MFHREARRRDSGGSPAPSRRELVLGAMGIAMGADRALAVAGAHVNVDGLTIAGLSMKLTRYAATGQSRRPAILLLHGSKGLDANFQAYDRYACTLAEAGIDALVFSYFDPEEGVAIGAARSGSARQRLYARSVDRWVSVVRSIAGAVQQNSRSSGHVGLLGFSLGGFVAVAAASRPMFSVLTVFYAGLPAFYDRPVTFLPPLLDIHGDADRAVPLTEGERLVATATRLGGVAELAVFGQEGHGFDLDATNRDAAAAMARAVAFTSRWLA